MFKWDRRFMDMATLVSMWSKDPSTKCGAVIIDPMNRVVSVGYNGFPRGCDDSVEKYKDRDTKLLRILHAERNAILFARRDLTGCTIYVHPLPPCAHCTGMIIQTGITRVVTREPTEEQYIRWADHLAETFLMLKEAGVEITFVDCPKPNPINRETQTSEGKIANWILNNGF